MPDKFAILQGSILNKNDLNSAITRGKKWENVFIDKLPKVIKPYKYAVCELLNISPYTIKASIYKISREGDDKVYIGQTKKDIEERLLEHLSCKGKNDKFHSVITEDNKNEWKIEALEVNVYSNQRDIDNKETYFINTYQQDKLYNTLKIEKKIVKKKITVNNIVKIKGITDDKTRNAWVVRVKGLPNKRFSYRKVDKDESYKLAKIYALGINE